MAKVQLVVFSVLLGTHISHIYLVDYFLWNPYIHNLPHDALLRVNSSHKINECDINSALHLYALPYNYTKFIDYINTAVVMSKTCFFCS